MARGRGYIDSLTTPLAAVFALTGASALALQVVWQRVISLHTGVDLTSSTTVVAGFLAGLGIGSLWGGRLADRLGAVGSLRLFAAANAGVAVFAWFSIDVFYDLSRELAPSLASRPASFAFNVVALLVPTVLQGLSLPLVARVVTRRAADSGPLVGRLYGINTIGAAVGAVVSGWYLVGEFGFVTTVRVAAAANLVAAGVVLWIARRASEDEHRDEDREENRDEAPDHDPTPLGVRRWYVVYGLAGAIALGFQQVLFRLVDSAMRSNAYSFSLVLAIYLGVWGLGAAIGSSIVRRTVRHREWFAWLQVGSGLAAALALVLLVRIAPHTPLDGPLQRWFSTPGFASGFERGREADMVWFALVLPAFLIAAPILMIGMSFPFVQAIVASRVDRVGRRTGGLAAANIIGNVAGTMIVGFVLIDRLGTAGTYRLLTALLGGAGIVAVAVAPRQGRSRPVGIAVVVVMALLVVAIPSNHQLWAFLVARDPGLVLVAEDHSCGSLMIAGESGEQLVINGAEQNGHPFDDFHVLIGLLPALLQPEPSDGIAIGFGVGSTTYAMLADPRAGSVTTVELCGGNYELARDIRDRGDADYTRLFDDDRSELVVGDGRRHLQVNDDRYDVVVVDTLRPTSANSGSHFSREFFELIDDRLTDTGIAAEWAPTYRTQNAAAATFPYLITGTVADYNNSIFFLGSRSPIEFDRGEVLRRFDAIDDDVFVPEQRASLRAFIADWTPTCITNGERATGIPDADITTDLHPRDEYSLQNGVPSPDIAVTTC